MIRIIAAIVTCAVLFGVPLVAYHYGYEEGREDERKRKS